MPVINPVVIQKDSIFNVGVTFGPNNLQDMTGATLYVGKPHPSGSTVIPSNSFGVYNGKHIFGSAGLNLEIAPGWTVIDTLAFTYFNYQTPTNQGPGTLTIPDTVTTISGSAFLNAWFSGELIIPRSVNTIGGGASGAFQSSTSRWSFEGRLLIPNTLTTIQGNNNLNNVGIHTLEFEEGSSNSNWATSNGLFYGAASYSSVQTLIFPSSFGGLYFNRQFEHIGLNLTNLYCHSSNPPMFNSSITRIHPMYGNAICHVPEGAIPNYISAGGNWPTDPERYIDDL